MDREDFNVLIHALDLLLVIWILYVFLKQIESRRALAALLGFSSVFLLNIFAKFAGMATLAWILDGIVTNFGLVLLIVFRDEARRALGLLGSSLVNLKSTISSNELDSIVKSSIINLSSKRIGAFLIIEHNDKFNDHLKNGINVDSIISPETLQFFASNSKGGILISDNRIKKVGVVVPELEADSVDPNLDLKKSAAIWLTRRFDCVVIIVSADDGSIETIQEGKPVNFFETKLNLKKHAKF